MRWALVPLIRNASFKMETSILQIRVFKVKAWGPQLILGNPGGNGGGGGGEISLGRSSLFGNEMGRDRPGWRMVES